MLLIMLLAICTNGYAQNMEATLAELYDGEVLVQTAENRASAKLQKEVRLQEGKQNLVAVLKSIAQQVGLKLSYSEQLIPSDKEVHITGTKNTAEQALWDVLSGTPYRFGVSASGQLVLMRTAGTQSKKEVQTGTISGKVVVAESGETLPGANVFIKATGQGASTDANGEFSISNVESGVYEITATFIGYRRNVKEVEVVDGETTELVFKMVQSNLGLNEVVVTGYSSQTKREFTGSMSTVGSEELENVSLQNAEALLQGRASGVQLTTSSGNPGGGFEIRVRGEGSITAGNGPLWIVDGVQINSNSNTEGNDVSPLNSIPASDIESIEVLKDASAAAIYGAQAANGVVLISTKRGRKGDAQITVNYETGIRKDIKRLELMNSQEWVEYHFEAQGESETRGDVEDFGYDRNFDPESLPTFDWQDYIYRNGVSNSVNVSASGGNENTTYYIGGAWENTEAQVKEVKFERFNLRTNFDHQFTSKFSSNLNINLTSSSAPGVCQDGFYVNCPFYQSIEEVPMSFPYIDADGNLTGSRTIEKGGRYNPYTEQGLNNNPAVILNEEERSTKVTHILANMAPTYEFADWLSLSGMLAMDYRLEKEKDWERPIADPGNDGSVNRRVGTVSNFSTNIRLNAYRTFSENHNVSGLLGAEYRREYVDEIEATQIGIGNSFLGVIDAAATPESGQGFNTEFRIASYFGQLKYNFDERYYATVTSRYDGSSRFGKDKRWGFFPSASVAWRISEESFFNIDAINELKLRAGYGITGNAAINNFEARGLFGVAGSYKGTTGLTATQLANNALTWEEASEINLGLDYALFNNRVSGSIDLYKRINTDLLLDRPLPTDSGLGSITENIGEVENRGIEFEIRTVNMDLSDFLWSTRFNIAIQQNEVKDLVKDSKMLDPSDDDPIAVGHSLEAFWMPRWAGVNPADGRPMWYDANGNITYRPTTADNVFLDGGEQDVIGGFGNRFSYKGLSVDIFFQYSFGQTVQPETEFSYLFSDEEGVLKDVHTDRWREAGDIAKYPRASENGTGYFEASGWSDVNSSNSLFDASYIRLKNVSVSYTLPARISDKLGLRSVRIYGSGLNLMTWTAYPYLDPETVGNESSASFPTALQVNGGVELQF
ncbi:SusC/RagA family TonB-linked outer membrane protein [Fodinibius halophilus]|uniref:TonB-dependent receptor n=1 Tax=Fodinibius halophilus TaxID=1736908 RepID=A0A6M1TGM5_9BACT|nr:TonB-dependent receptor [Fodinibius halophilus]NGP89252.1 TonB-dependent receptor [Fodinibius halophilus]